MRMKLVLFIIALMVSVQAATASDIGVGVSPGNMSYRLAPGASAEQSLYVINTGTETATYNVFVDDNAYESWFTFSASSFELRAGENKEVKVTLKVPASAEEDTDCKIKIPCTVPGGDVGTGVIIPVHIEISTYEGSSSGASSSGSSSSGGGGGSPEPASNVEVKELTQQHVVSGSRARFSFTQDATCVTYVEFDAKKSLGKITTIVELLKEKSTLTPDIPGGEVYSYLNIWAGNDGIATPENIENAVVGFKVDKTWANENEFDANSITLDYYDGEKWEPLSAKKVNEDEGYIYLEAKTTGFSHFAIIGEKSDEVEGNPGMAPITRAGEKLKETAETLETTAVKSLDEKGHGVLAEIEGYGEKLRELYLDLIHSLEEKGWLSQSCL
ncbi:hypothetical protein EO98_16795 [Methanosarcina sp. 2.H.T.1A.6]|uniref:PGF-pre-PGF domain-containing protein n=1 Tax=unclassified Methanosarcina TaxID=2644672 RepID=UPI000621FCA6|nr:MULTISPECIES: PGF-pre-PGF domain-containing protein [unclassified Methanosarcina]KKG13423.1 hypothetical protein EO97_10160 [Methanosarcina sp. 2.H.T.1A.15]KKG15022.1 hypothetical protein EO94_03850 [Methanosarcina sp. 2.H.T.1A.3]KKG20721.1 hypothetical protein EO96_17840 [Methanosarcina sp. 2.H.T.1A.8]KKG22038.1 hypothetical protein EO98_16795 [Methanosarcina sp. 2.H.T.1A.6]